MKRLFSYLSIVLALLSVSCHKNSGNIIVEGRFKARLEIKGMCMNYTLSIVEGSIDPRAVEAKWTDPQTGKTYTNAFAISNPCEFPKDLNEGDEFYIEVITPHTQSGCVVCAAYYPTPGKSLFFRLVK